MAQNLTVLFMPESAYGPTNQCIGLGRVLRNRGHTVVFASERSWQGRLAPHGFVEALVDLAEPAGSSASSAQESAGQFWIDFINDTAPVFRTPTIDQLASFVQPTYQALIDGAVYVQPQLEALIAEHRPDVIALDNVVTFPALLTAGVPFVRIVSCNPLEIRGPHIPPTFSGYPADDRRGWAQFLDRFDATHGACWAAFNDWVQQQGAPPLPARDFIHTSGAANLYLYPRELDYVAERPLDATWHRMESSVREVDGDWSVPEQFAGRPAGSALIYLSLGSLGGADIGLLQRLIDLLGDTRHRVVVSMGPRAAEIRLADNMVGSETVPQTRVIPHMDLVITHGGNNTVTESLHFGKPMIVLPLFWDQHDNAQRVAEKGYGVRLSTYEFADHELIDAIERILGDDGMRRRAAATGEAIRARDGLRAGAAVIERIGAAATAARAAPPVGREARPGAGFPPDS